MKRKALFVLVFVFITLGWMGCKEPPHYGPVRYVFVDSTLTACGMDSFLIKSPWMQKYINTALDSTRADHWPPTEFAVCHFIDKDSNDFFIYYCGGWSSPGWLYDCEGNFIEKKAPWQQLADDRESIEFSPLVVNVMIGLYSM